MTKDDFKKLCWSIFKEYGFRKQKKYFYFEGNSNIECYIDLQKSDYGESFYINCSFCVKNYFAGSAFVLENIVCFNRIQVMSVSMRDDAGGCFLTQMIVYKDYTDEEISRYLRQALDEWIMPPLAKGGAYIVENEDKYIFLNRNTSYIHSVLLGN